jgi:hypothetical protein
MSYNFAPFDINDDSWKPQNTRNFAPLEVKSNVVDFDNSSIGEGEARRIKKKRQQAESERLKADLNALGERISERHQRKWEIIIEKSSSHTVADSVKQIIGDKKILTFEDLE